MSGAAVLLAELVAAGGLYAAGARRVRRWPAWRGGVLRGRARRPRGRPARPRRRPLADRAHGPAPGLAFVAAPLLVLGSPLALGAAGATRARRAPAGGVGGAAGRRLGRARGAHGGQPAPGGLRRAARHPLLHVAEHVAWLTAAVLFWRVVAGADPVPHRPGPIGRLLYLLLFSAPMGATGAWLHVEQRPVVRGPLAGRPARRGRAHARRRGPGAGGGDGGRGLGGDPARAPPAGRLRGGGGAGEARRRRCGARWSPGRVLRRDGGVVGGRGRPVAAPAAAARRAAALAGPRPRALRPGLRLLPRRGPARAPRTRARRCAAPARQRPTSTCRPGACRSPTPTDEPTRTQPAYPRGRHRRARRLRRLASAARRSRGSTPRAAALAAGHASVHRALRRLPPDRRRAAGIVTGAARPRPATTRRRRQIAEAVRVGPYLMPKFSERADRPAARSTRSPATSSRIAPPATTAAAGASATSGPSPRAWSRGSWPGSCCSASPALIGERAHMSAWRAAWRCSARCAARTARPPRATGARRRPARREVARPARRAARRGPAGSPAGARRLRRARRRRPADASCSARRSASRWPAWPPRSMLAAKRVVAAARSRSRSAPRAHRAARGRRGARRRRCAAAADGRHAPACCSVPPRASPAPALAARARAAASPRSGPGSATRPTSTPWRRGRRLVDHRRRAAARRRHRDRALPVRAARGRRQARARLARRRRARRPAHAAAAAPAAAGWAPEGILAFSQICTHAGCAVTLFRYPVDEQLSQGPGARLPVPLLDLRRRARRPSRSSGPAARAAAAAAAGDRRRRHARRRRPAVGLGRAGVVGRASGEPLTASLDVVAAIDRRLGAGRVARTALRYVFPDHWSFLLGEIALYAFVVLVATGIYLALFFTPDVSGRPHLPRPLRGAAGRRGDPAPTARARAVLDRPRRACSCARPITGRRSSSSPRWSCTCCGCSSPPPSAARAS